MNEYLTQLEQALGDESTSVEAFLRMVFDDDPTCEQWSHDLWHQVLPMLKQKLPPLSRYTMTVTEAAKSKKCQPDTIRKAIKRGEIDAHKDGSWRIDPVSLKKWSRHRKEKTPARTTLENKKDDVGSLYVCFGNEKGGKLNIRVDGNMIASELVKNVGGNVNEATLEQWSSIAVGTSSPKGRRFMVLVPGDSYQEFKHGSFFVRGNFQIQGDKINNSKKADVAWKAYLASYSRND